MPKASMWIVRAALLYLMIGAALGAVLLIAKVAPIGMPWPVVRTLHIELLAFGWTANLAMGVAFWILPRVPSRGANGAVVTAAFATFNAGVLLIAFGALFGVPGVILPARLAQLGGAVIFARHAWTRARPSLRTGTNT